MVYLTNILTQIEPEVTTTFTKCTQRRRRKTALAGVLTAWVALNPGFLFWNGKPGFEATAWAHE